MLGCLLLVQQAAIGNCLSFDPFPFDQNGLASSEVDVGRCEIADALMISQVIIIGDEGLDLAFEIAWWVIVLEQDPVLECLMPALDLALGHRMVRCARYVPYSGHRAIWPGPPRCSSSRCRKEKPWPVDDLCLVEARGLQGQVQHGGDILGRHC
jgi:hypothetical protein